MSEIGKDKQSQISSETELLHNSIDSLQSLSEKLVNGLTPVLRTKDEPPTPTDEKQPILAPHADRLRMFRERIHNVNERLESALARLEL